MSGKSARFADYLSSDDWDWLSEEDARRLLNPGSGGPTPLHAKARFDDDGYLKEVRGYWPMADGRYRPTIRKVSKRTWKITYAEPVTELPDPLAAYRARAATTGESNAG